MSAKFWARSMRVGECWVWTGAIDTHGYGAVWSNGRQMGAHRRAYELSRGAIPKGLTIDHLCRNRACINPSHLEPVTVRVNVLRGVGITALAARRTQCKYGHPLDGKKARQRYCKTCARKYTEARRARMKGESHE